MTSWTHARATRNPWRQVSRRYAALPLLFIEACPDPVCIASRGKATSKIRRALSVLRVDQICVNRDFLSYISAPKVRATNPQCLLKTEVVCDRSEPTVTFSLQSGEKVILKTALLTSLNVLELYNKHITSLIPPDPAKLEAKKELLEEKRKKKRRPHHRIKLWSKRRGVIL